MVSAIGDLRSLISEPSRLCAAAVEVLRVDGAGVSLISGGALHGQLCASDETIARLETVQFSLGEGPCGAAFERAVPVLEPDLPSAVDRWPVFAAEALSLGVRAVFAFPLGPGLACVGVLTLYRHEARDLSAEQLTDALLLSDVVAEAVMTAQLGADGDELRGRLAFMSDGRASIHQATGMVSVQLGVTPADALSVLRAHAWAGKRTLAETASDVVARKLRFPTDGRQPG